MNKKLIIYSASLIVLAVLALIGGYFLHISSAAHKRIDAKTQELVLSNEQLQTRLDFLDADVSKKTDNSSEKEDLNRQITEMTEKIAAANSELNAEKSSLWDVKSKTSAVNNVYNTLKKGMNPTRGAARTLNDAKLLCPAQIKEGRYIATGSGIITITSLSGTARVFENLSELDTNSYTFNLETGEDIEARGSVTIAELR